jgi:hypothetical protein
MDEIARACHEINRAYCAAIGDLSQLPWEEAPEWQRDSAIGGVDHAMNNRAASPEDSHNSWLRAKYAAGWKYGPIKNIDTKEHPCCVPYEQLSMTQRAKDHIFLAVVRNLEII